MEEGTLIPQLQRLRCYFPRGALELADMCIKLLSLSFLSQQRLAESEFTGSISGVPRRGSHHLSSQCSCSLSPGALAAHPALCPDLPVLSSKSHTSPKWEEIPLPTMFRHKNIHSVSPVSIYHSWNSISPMRLATRLVRPSHHLLILWSY